MKTIKASICVLCLGVFWGCVPVGPEIDWSTTKFHELDVRGDAYFFRYPDGSLLYEHDAKLIVEFEGCKVSVDSGQFWGTEGEYKPETKERKGLKYTAWYKNDETRVYDVEIVDLAFVFRVGDGESDASSCITLVDGIAESFTGELDYRNELYNFGLILPADFEAEYFPGDEGLALRKRMEVQLTEDQIEDEKDSQYKVEIFFLPFSNSKGYGNISDFISGEYSGYTIEFGDYGDYSGFFVGEGAGGYAIRHYFVLSDDGGLIYDAYLKVPSEYYGQHKEEFDTLMGQMEFF